MLLNQQKSIPITMLIDMLIYKLFKMFLHENGTTYSD